MSERDLDSAGIFDPVLRSSYETCRRLNAAHGKTYYLATLLLPPAKRPYVHALYGFARHADEIVDNLDSSLSTAEKERVLEEWGAGFLGGEGDGALLPAVHDTVRRWDIPLEHFRAFLASMRMDLTVTDYPDRASLERYMYGSAEVIGLQMLPILGTVGPREDAAPAAAALGKAFQLTNFLRDVDEDLDRGRVYLPADELAAHGVDRDVLRWCQSNRRIDARVRRALQEQHAITRRVYAAAQPGVAQLAPASRPCVETALKLYSEILDRIEEIDFEIFAQRATVGKGRRLAVAGAGVVRAWGARLRHRKE